MLASVANALGLKSGAKPASEAKKSAASMPQTAPAGQTELVRNFVCEA